MLTFAQFIAEEQQDYNIKGWMSPKGVPHLFDSMMDHSDEHHPGICKSVQRELQKAGHIEKEVLGSTFGRLHAAFLTQACSRGVRDQIFGQRPIVHSERPKISKIGEAHRNRTGLAA